MGDGRKRLSPAALDVIQQSFLGTLPAGQLDRLLVEAEERTHGRGVPLSGRVGAVVSPPIALVIRGRLRMSIVSPDGREFVTRYLDRGSFLGLMTLVAVDHGLTALRESMVVSYSGRAQTLEETTLVTFRPSTVARLAKSEPILAWRIAGEIVRQVGLTQELATTNVFNTIRVRVARHLESLMVAEGDRLYVDASHQQIADSVGAVRETVTRVVSALTKDGIVRRAGNRIEVLDVERLTSEAGYS